MTTIYSLFEIFQKHPNVTTDSRKITEGCLFFALKGENFDGNTFAEKAIAEGAAYAVIDNPEYKKGRNYLLVEDVLQALQQLATFHRRQFEFPLIAIAGSNGKTTTKELVSAVMSMQYNTHFTKGNLNNHIGVPLTLLQLTEDHDVAVIEIGANHQGENLLLCEIAEPTHGVVTNMGKDHLEGFGGFEGSKKANAEVFNWLAQHNGTIFINDDELYLKDWLPTEGGHKIYYRQNEKPSMAHHEYEASLESAAPFLRIGFLDEKGNMLHAQSHLVGEHNFANINTAIAIGKYFKVPARKIKEAIENYIPSMNRSQIITHASGATILLDAYNANPSSMEAALKTLSQMPHTHKIAIIGDMRELGDESQTEHELIFNYAKSLNFNQLVTVGTEFARINTEGVSFKNNEEARDWFNQQKFDSNTCILFKASRGIGLERILN